MTRAENGRVAVAKAAAGDYAAILMDIEMPEMDGLEATKAIRSREAETAAGSVIAPIIAPIIAMTGHTSSGMKLLCEKAGMTTMLLKPFSLDALRDKLADLCGDDLEMVEL
jgi:CheY-like chemotaxis protein